MGSFGRARKGRARLLVIAILMAFITSAVPVFADPVGGEQAPSGESESAGEVDPSLLPDAADLAAAEKQLEEREAQREEELESPGAIVEREESALAYKDLESAGAVSDLLRSSFPEELASLEMDPARVLTDATLKRNLGNEGGAVVVDEGKTSLIDADIPAEVPAEDGQLEQVDLSLDATSEGFEPENPTTDLLIPTSPAEAVSIEEGEISISQVGADPQSSAHPFGDKDVIYPEVQADTDLLVSPRAEGVELYDQLRSPQSPETLSFHLGIPGGAELRLNGDVAEVLQGEKMIALVSSLHAVDAQGTEVPVTMAVQGDTIVLGVAHREAEYAYPILVDPEVGTQNNWSSNSWEAGNRYDVLEDSTFIDWNNNPGLKTSKWCLYACWGSGRGLFVSFPTNGYGYNQQAQWAYFVKGETTYLQGYLISPFRRDDHGCPRSTYSEPHDFDGAWAPAPINTYYSLYTNRAPAGNAANYGNEAHGVKAMVFGLNSGNGVQLPCWRDIYAGGLATYMSDPEKPTLDAISGQPTGWFDDSKMFGVNVSAHDPGLGVSNIALTIEGEAGPRLKQNYCYGEHDYPCPRDMSGTIPFNGDNFDEGVSLAKVVASDALSKASDNQPTFWAYVDNTPPEITLSGQLATVTEETEGNGKDPKEWDDLTQPVYNLGIKAKDGSSASNKTRRSGVKNIEIYLDKKTGPETVSWSANASPCENCEKNVTFPLKLDGLGLSAGKHTLLVVAVDQMGHKSQRDIEFEYIPATGMKDDYVMQHFPLPDGKGNEAEEEHPTRPELAVNVMNGNLTYREKDVDVPGYAADLEVERFYNSQLPNNENTEWGDGWTLAQTPELKPEAGSTPKEAELLDTSGALEDDVQLPTEAGKTKFNPPLQASVTKEAGGGYELTDESGETATSIAFNSNGLTDELRTDEYAKIDYDYEAGKLDEIAVKDPGSASDISAAEEEVLEYVPPAPTFKSSFGVAGSGDGQQSRPIDIALAPNGDLFVLDWSQNRVQRFDQTGKYISKFGSAGTENGQFKGPTSIEIDPSGNLYVADRGNNRIEKFNEKGEFIKAFGSYGTGNGQFAAPSSVAIDTKGNVYVADTSNQRVEKFNSNGEYISKFGAYGKGSGQFYEPSSLDVGPGGSIWVADHSLNRITQFNEAGGFVQTFGSLGSGDGQFNGANGIDVDSRGNVWVIDQGNGRVEQFAQSGKYLSKFGTKGTGSGQFDFTGGTPLGIAVDNKGGLWVADHMNTRIQKWSVPNYRPSWSFAFGVLGSGDGQMKSPADVDLAANGDLLVLDKGNNRVVRFDRSSLKFISKFGTTGTANGQFTAPNSLAVDPSGNIWVADSGNYRVEEFSDEGTFIRAFGSNGTGDGQFSKIEGIATDLKGNVLVADTYNKRVQVFDEEGKFLFKFGSAGSGLGQFTEANAIDVGPHGDVYVADWGLNRVEKFNEKGVALLQFGSTGTGDGQFNHADSIEVDNKGNVWVGDQTNGRIELFSESGQYVTQVGSVGSGEGQFKFTYPMGIAVDTSGGIWITDVLNNRIQKWQIPNTDPPKPPEENDPAVDVTLSSGLVSSVEGDEAGTNTYVHTGELLTANKGPDGETNYEYDTSGRLKKVTLPNGTYGSITYNTTYGRVSKVTVDPAGAEPAKSTSFAYSDEPRRTTVTPSDATIITYDIGADGSIVKWQDKNAPPTIDNLSGLLYTGRGKELQTGVNSLKVLAHSPQGIRSIQILTNGTNLVDEYTCTEDENTTEVECAYPPTDEWVMETEDFSPGKLNVEVLVTDRKGEVAAERFWVNIPPPPLPPPAGLPVKPKFKEIARFREEFGLEVWDPVSGELELNDRIFDLINAWVAEDPVARSSWERWGVPLRTQDVAELEYRERYIEVDAPLISHWAEAHAPNSYAGYYVDHREGGLIHVGFTSNQDALLSQLISEVGSMASDRLRVYPVTPSNSMATLASLQNAITSTDAVEGPLAGQIASVGIDQKSGVVKVGALNPSLVASGLKSAHGTGAPISVFQTQQPEELESHFTNQGPARPGQAIGYYEAIKSAHHWCTAGFGVKEETGRINKATGKEITAPLLLTAGHCFSTYPLGFVVRRFNGKSDTAGTRVGETVRRSNGFAQGKFKTDAEEVSIDAGWDGFASGVLRSTGSPVPVTGVATATQGMVLHFSGATTGPVGTGYVTGPAIAIFNLDHIGQGEGGPFLEIPTTLVAGHGDSGAPVWTAGGKAVAMIASQVPPSEEPKPTEMALTPMITPEMSSEVELLGVGSGPIGPNAAPGALHAPGMGKIHLAITP